jgi:hypothetical protein
MFLSDIFLERPGSHSRGQWSFFAKQFFACVVEQGFHKYGGFKIEEKGNQVMYNEFDDFSMGLVETLEKTI